MKQRQQVHSPTRSDHGVRTTKASGYFTNAAPLAQLLRLGRSPGDIVYPHRDGRRGISLKYLMQPVQCRAPHILAIENLSLYQNSWVGGRFPDYIGGNPPATSAVMMASLKRFTYRNIIDIRLHQS